MNKESDLKNTSVNGRYVVGMHATSIDESDSKHSEYASCESDSSVETTTSIPEPVENAQQVVCKPKVWNDAPIIEEYESDSDNDLVSNVQEEKEKPSFAFIDSNKHVKTSRENVKENGTPNHSPKVEKQDRNGHTKKVNGARQNYSGQAALASTASKVNTARPCDDPHRALKDKGIIDSGCSRHTTGNKAHLANYQEFKGGFVAFGGSNGRITSKGKIKAGRLDFKDVYYVEELKHYNLFSVSQICDKKNKVLFTDTDCFVMSPDFKLPDENQVLLKIPRQYNMYSFNLKNIDPSGDLACLFTKASIDKSNKWHGRLDRVNFKNLNKLVNGNLVRCLPCKIFENDHTCVACQKESNTRPFVRPRQLKGIKREYGNAKSPKQNGFAKRKNRTLIEAARTILGDSFSPTTFWAEAVNTACYVLNKVASDDLRGALFVLYLTSAHL
nr:ribonuclease H-like domain-containing protein [Tanacetum cinerariifolium]